MDGDQVAHRLPWSRTKNWSNSNRFIRRHLGALLPASLVDWGLRVFHSHGAAAPACNESEDSVSDAVPSEGQCLRSSGAGILLPG